MNASFVVALLACVAYAAGTNVVGQQYYVPSAYSGVQYVQQPHTYSYVQPSVSGVKYVQQQYASVPSTQQYVYNSVPSYYQSPVVSSYGYGAYSPSYYYPSQVYGYVKK